MPSFNGCVDAENAVSCGDCRLEYPDTQLGLIRVALGFAADDTAALPDEILTSYRNLPIIAWDSGALICDCLTDENRGRVTVAVADLVASDLAATYLPVAQVNGRVTSEKLDDLAVSYAAPVAPAVWEGISARLLARGMAALYGLCPSLASAHASRRAAPIMTGRTRAWQEGRMPTKTYFDAETEITPTGIKGAPAAKATC